jgi:hypothetical protein
VAVNFLIERHVLFVDEYGDAYGECALHSWFVVDAEEFDVHDAFFDALRQAQGDGGFGRLGVTGASAGSG